MRLRKKSSKCQWVLDRYWKSHNKSASPGVLIKGLWVPVNRQQTMTLARLSIGKIYCKSAAAISQGVSEGTEQKSFRKGRN